MEFCKHLCWTLTILVLTFSKAKPQDPAPAPPADPAAAAAPPAGAAPAGPAAPTIVIDLDASTTESPKEVEMEGKLVELKAKECKMLFGDCWASIKLRKRYAPEQRRLKLCLKRIHNYLMCELMTEEQATQAKDETEALLVQRWEEEEEKIEEDARRQQLKRRRIKAAKNKGANPGQQPPPPPPS